MKTKLILNEAMNYTSYRDLVFKLAENYGVTLTNYTELEIWTKVRDWICNTELNIVKRIIFGYLISL